MQDAHNSRDAATWQTALDGSDVAMLVVAPVDNRIIEFNDAALALVGLSGYDLQKHQVHELFPGQLPQLSGLTLECLATGRAWSMDLEVGTGAAPARPVETFMSRADVAGQPCVLFVMLDLKPTQRRRAQAELDRMRHQDSAAAGWLDAAFRQLERGNQLILNAAGEGIYGVDANGLTTFLNPAAERMLGYRASELIGRDAHSAIHHSHQDGSRYPSKACPIYAAFRDGRVHRVDDEVFWRKDGTSFPVEYTSTPIQEQGRLLGAVVVFRDVSGQREAQAQLVHALEEVEALKRRLQLENAYLQDELRGVSNHKEIVGNSTCVRNILKQIDLVSPTSANVLITGESGTGKELIARAIHDASDRRERPLIRVNCASIPRELFESEFFGHAKGAFTGAISERVGRFELADGGTIFLDEIGELPIEHQAKLLRILQEGQFERVGDVRTRKVDVRVVAATNRDLKTEVAEKRFREDLFFRLNVFPIVSPPLRERLDDIPVLATLFLKRAMKRANRSGLQISLADIERLQGYHWPGNIRELENVIERAVITASDGKLRFHVPQTRVLSDGDIACDQDAEVTPAPRGENPVSGSHATAAPAPMTDADRRALERDAIVAALTKTKGRVSGAAGAAELIGVKPTTLYSRIKKHGIDASSFKR